MGEGVAAVDNAGLVVVVAVGGTAVESEWGGRVSESREGVAAGDVVAGSATYPWASCGW